MSDESQEPGFFWGATAEAITSAEYAAKDVNAIHEWLGAMSADITQATSGRVEMLVRATSAGYGFISVYLRARGRETGAEPQVLTLKLGAEVYPAAMLYAFSDDYEHCKKDVVESRAGILSALRFALRHPRVGAVIRRLLADDGGISANDAAGALALARVTAAAKAADEALRASQANAPLSPAS